ncbi:MULTISPECIES: thioesterase family protein [Bacillaceae]|uniref:acyl-CoA thioesterase n=1 Tax=Bacillaceae TaxID=186817 RepID=UPI0022781B9B|nr:MULTISPECIES: thioesterase family protein [Bacillaceae]MDL0436321.1 thioesterase family protein [Niallia sp. SS-2023]
MEYVHKLDLKIDYADTDMMGVVYHANYLKFFERGRTALIEDIGYSYVAMEDAGYFAPVYDVQATYKKPLRYGEKAYVKTWIDLNDGIKTVYGYQIVNEQGDLCVEGTTTHIIVSKDSFRPKSFKKTFPEWFQKYEELKKK